MKKYIFAIIISICLLMPAGVAKAAFNKAAFNLAITDASYDCNTGVLIIKDQNFILGSTKGYCNVELSKIKLGGTIVAGRHHFTEGVLRINASNKTALNEQIGCQQNNSIENALNLSAGAIIKNTYPPNGINVVFSLSSNEQQVSVNVTGIIPKTTIDTLSVNKNTVNSHDEVLIIVTGHNLNISTLKIQNIKTAEMQSLKIDDNIATVKIKVLENKESTNRVDNYALYLNDIKTDKTISITVLPIKIEQEENNEIDQEENISPKPAPEDKENTNQLPAPEDKENTNQLPVPPNPEKPKPEDKENTTTDENISDSNTEKDHSEENNVSIKQENKAIFWVTGAGIILIVVIVTIFIFKKLLKKKKLAKDISC